MRRVSRRGRKRSDARPPDPQPPASGLPGAGSPAAGPVRRTPDAEPPAAAPGARRQPGEPSAEPDAGAVLRSPDASGSWSLTPGFLYRDAVRVLSSWEAPDDPQERLRLRFLRHLEEHPADGLWRECADGHITASTAVLDASRTRVLLTLHSKVRAWLQLGGHCEPGDLSLAGAALREATEESGIPGLRLLPEPVQLDRHEVRCHPQGTWHLDVQYVAVAPPGARHALSDESDDLRWFPVDELPESADEAVRRLVARAVPQSG
ncbi:NUDIX hydrolase [Actinomadura madurae]|uniref:8-oxo-dGTP pyrophosphatase MutT, NUDIX family n=1 Tax=Actinomadura madurae TaxID=1993 RepID=A0A1I5J521_9ACTN|nr:8-oxo-dGTP pyrophosphatase MutT, NUDIX family [Actinomadura madurae]SPT58642.1 NUDIX domain [Actinomadura madurae]